MHDANTSENFWVLGNGCAGGVGGVLDTPAYTPQNDPHVALIILNTRMLDKKNSKTPAFPSGAGGWLSRARSGWWGWGGGQGDVNRWPPWP